MTRKKADKPTEVVENDAPDAPETVKLEKPFKYAFRGLDVVTFKAGEYTVVDEYDPESTDTIPAEVVAVL